MVRRVVIGHDEQGKSIVVSDGTPPLVTTTEDIRRMSPEQSKQVFAALGNEQASTFGKSGRHPLMHRTQTIDYALVLAGEIYCVLDAGEVLLKAGDVLIQCGTNHAWSNRSNAPCDIAFVLIDGVFDADLAARLD